MKEEIGTLGFLRHLSAQDVALRATVSFALAFALKDSRAALPPGC